MNPDDKPVNLPQVDDKSSSMPKTTSTSNDSAIQPQAQQPNDLNTSRSVAMNIPVPDEAADSDLIEKEWVERAKQIVEHTKDDPHEQQRAVSQMKTDYLKKRYDKDIGSVSG